MYVISLAFVDRWRLSPLRVLTVLLFLLVLVGTAAAQAARIAASEIHGTGRKKGKEKVHENRWKVAADAAANASKHGEIDRPLSFSWLLLLSLLPFVAVIRSPSRPTLPLVRSAAACHHLGL